MKTLDSSDAPSKTESQPRREKGGSIRTLGRYLVCWSLILFFTVLLTLVFSFVGTLMCTLLAGMMMGAVKPSKWLSGPISVLFPMVIFLLMHRNGVELTEGQIDGLASLCFAGFWGIYLGASWVVRMERTREPTSECATAAAPRAPTSAPDVMPLAIIQGEWIRVGLDATGHPEKQVIEIHDHELIFTVIDEHGQPRLAAHGALDLGAH